MGAVPDTVLADSIHPVLAVFLILLGLFLGSSFPFDLLEDVLRWAAGFVQSVFYRTLRTAGDSAVFLIASSETEGPRNTLGYVLDNLRSFWTYFGSAISAAIFRYPSVSPRVGASVVDAPTAWTAGSTDFASFGAVQSQPLHLTAAARLRQKIFRNENVKHLKTQT